MGKKVEEDVDDTVRAEHRGQERGIGRVTVERNERASPSVETIYARVCQGVYFRPSNPKFCGCE